MTFAACWQTPPAELRLGLDEAHVWLAGLEVSPEKHAELFAVLNTDESARALRYLQAHHRFHSAAARGYLRTLLGRYLGIAPQSVELQFNSYGKPSLAGTLAAGGLRFNVSHSRELALFAFTRGRELGVDIEKIRPDFASTEIARRFFSAAESARLLSLSPELRTKAFFECWTRKEAYIKARGDGLSRRLDTFEVAFGPGVAPAVVSAADEPDAAVRWAVHDLQPADGYCGALIVEVPDVAIRCWKMD